MNIKTVGHNCIYNLSLVANLFFQNTDDAQITSVANRLGDTLYAHTKITYNNKTHSSVFSAFCKTDEDFLLVKRLTNVVCGMSLSPQNTSLGNCNRHTSEQANPHAPRRRQNG